MIGWRNWFVALLVCSAPLVAQETEEQVAEEVGTKKRVLQRFGEASRQVEEAQDQVRNPKDSTDKNKRMVAEATRSELAKELKQLQDDRKILMDELKATEIKLADSQKAYQEIQRDLVKTKEVISRKDLLDSVTRKVGEGHAYSNVVRARLMEDIASMKAELVVASRRLGDDHPKVKQLNAGIARLQKAIPKAGGLAGAVDARTVSKLSEQIASLNLELARAKTQYGARHPRVLDLQRRLALLVDFFNRQQAKVTPEAALKKRYEALRSLEESLDKLEHREELERYRRDISAERADLETRLKLADKGAVGLLQAKRTREMLEMRQRLDQAQALAEDRAKTGGGASGDAMKTVLGRMDKLESKLDRIATLLERLVDK